MTTYLWIAIGSALGGMARHWCAETAARLFGVAFPWGTLFVNIAGSLVIGFFFAITGPEGRFDVPTNAKAFVMIGICGGYTTFSSFSLQTLALIQDEKWLSAGMNVVASVALCLVAVWLGYLAALASR